MTQTSTTPQERIRGMGLLFVCLMTLGMGHSLFFAIFPPLARDLGLSEVQASAIFTLSAVLWVLMSPFWGGAAMFGAASRLFYWVWSALACQPAGSPFCWSLASKAGCP